MFNKLSAYDKWVSENKELHIEAWELGITWFRAPIIEDTYEGFVLAMWKIESCQDQK